MPRMILGSRSGNAQTYRLGGTQMVRIESVSLTIDTTGAGSSSYAVVTFQTQDGQTLGTSQTSPFIDVNEIATVTLAPNLPDTITLSDEDISNLNQSGLVDTILTPLCTVTATASDPGAIVTAMRLWVDDVTDDQTAADDEAATLGNWALVPGAGA